MQPLVICRCCNFFLFPNSDANISHPFWLSLSSLLAWLIPNFLLISKCLLRKIFFAVKLCSHPAHHPFWVAVLLFLSSLSFSFHSRPSSPPSGQDHVWVRHIPEIIFLSGNLQVSIHPPSCKLSFPASPRIQPHLVRFQFLSCYLNIPPRKQQINIPPSFKITASIRCFCPFCHISH